MAGVGDAVVHDSAVAVDVVGHADDRNPPHGLAPLEWRGPSRGDVDDTRCSSVMNAWRFKYGSSVPTTVVTMPPGTTTTTALPTIGNAAATTAVFYARAA
jgi:hypothetical protein